MNNLLCEDEIIKNFAQKFSFLKDEPIVLYGLGENTKLLLDNLSDFKFVGLMDKNSVGLDVFGLPVLDPKGVANISKNIIIVCIYSSKNIVYQRICHLEKSGVNIYYFNGDKLEQIQEAPTTSYNKTLDNLKNEIKANDIISFDIFGTLLERTLTYSNDVFAIVQRRLLEEFDISFDFITERVKAEKLAQKKYGLYYTFDNIYEFIENSNKIKLLELETELNFIIPRKDVIEALNYAKSLDKKIILTSDMYFSKDFLLKMLKEIGLEDKFELNLSSDVKKSKYDGSIFEYYKEKYAGKKILHIGDDEYSDIQQAQKYKINNFYTPSVSTLYSEANLNLAKSIDDKILLGKFVANLFNSPFDNEINSMEKLGYLFIAPLLLNYMLWLYQQTKAKKVDKILFIARDGYILEKMYQYFPEPKPEGIYFYASRRALAVPSIKNIQDIKDTFNIFYLSRKITIQKFIHSAFGILINDKYCKNLLNSVDKDELLQYILENHTDKILENAHLEREEYNKYIEQTIKPNEKIVTINFVVNGATQYFSQKLFGDIECFCFQTTPKVKQLDLNLKNLHALYGDYLSPYISSNHLAKHFQTLEVILSSPDEQFVKFENGNKIFLNSKRENFEEIKQCHCGILTLFFDMIKSDNRLFTRNFDNDLINNILGLMFDDSKIRVNEKVKKNFNMTDSFAQNEKVENLW